MPEPVNLTDEQQAIVEHTHGPALVFAVAGAGKTTTMVHRIERLVRKKVFAAKNILATSFGRATVADIQSTLRSWPHCAEVRVLTLHSVGFRIITRAQQKGYIDNLKLNEQGGNLAYMILGRTQREARKENVHYRFELDNMDREDFLNYVGASKGNLAYATLSKARLPDAALDIATQAVAPVALPWYLDLYRRFEGMRESLDLITFDDMLLTGWEVLVRYPDILQEVQSVYRCVMVDEFQDVNRAQAELLDLITEPERNYMAIGDDDQTIYEWRGADPSFILDFTERYGARQYLIQDNFRSHASQIALANNVIRANKRRQEKHLSLTKGFGGETTVDLHNSGEGMAFEIVAEIKRTLETGVAPSDIAVLVRLYAQTSYIESFLISERIPYQIVGNVPFYQRNEILTLIYYLRLAQLDRRLQGGLPLTPQDVGQFATMWHKIINRPVRYVKADLRDEVASLVTLRGAPLGHALALVGAKAPNNGVASAMQELAETMHWLSGVIDKGDAHEVLVRLEARLGYRDYVRKHSGFVETGEANAANVDALLNYARSKGSPGKLLEHLDYISFHRLGKAQQDASELVTLTTVFRAKGLEWPLVIVPDCNDGIFPFGSPDRVEEERRLFYVAITRSEERLKLYATRGRPVSPFLEEANYEGTLERVDVVGRALHTPVPSWSTAHALAVARQVPELKLDRFISRWWTAEDHHIQQVAQQVQHLFRVATERNLSTRLALRSDSLPLWELFGAIEEASEGVEFTDLAEHIIVPKMPAENDGEDNPETGFLQHCRPGQKVRHEKFGIGTIFRVSDEGLRQVVEIDFPSFGVRKLLVRYAKLNEV